MKEEYKTIPGVSNEAVSLILDAACNTSLIDPNITRSMYERGRYMGFVSALQGILSSEEVPAHHILNAALEAARNGESWCVVVTTYGGHDCDIGVYGPYTLAEAKAKFQDLEASGYYSREDDQYDSTMSKEIVRMEKGGI